MPLSLSLCVCIYIYIYIWIEQGDPDVSEYGEIADLEYGMGLDEPPTSVIIKEEFRKRILYQMSPKEVYIDLFRVF